MDQYAHDKGVSKCTLDNIRRILSSFFTWLENEDYILKSPMRRIHKIKTRKTVKETYSDEELELMRDAVKNLRDRAHSPKWRTFLEKIYQRIEAKDKEENQ